MIRKVKVTPESLKDTEYAKKQQARKIAKPRRQPESTALTKYKKFKMIVRYLTLKKELSKSGFPAPYNSGHETKLKKYTVKMKKARKLAGPELIKLSRARRRSMNKGGGVGARLSKLK